MERIRAWVMEHIPHANIEEKTYHGQMRFAIPARSHPSAPQINDIEMTDEISLAPSGGNYGPRKKGNVSSLFTLLEANKEFLGLEYYSVSQTTLDQVFLKIVGQHQIEEEGYTAPARGFWRALFS
jgi:hypothetical protein